MQAQTPVEHASAARFPSTRWSQVIAAGGRDTADARESLAGLCDAYWYPLYAYIRRRGYSPQEAEDLTQDLFAYLLEHEVLANADPTRGRFRGFLRTICARFLANARDHKRAQKRGGGRRRCRSTRSMPKGVMHASWPICRRPSESLTARGRSPCWPACSNSSAASTTTRAGRRSSASCATFSPIMPIPARRAIPQLQSGCEPAKGPCVSRCTACGAVTRFSSAGRSRPPSLQPARSTTRSTPYSARSNRDGRVFLKALCNKSRSIPKEVDGAVRARLVCTERELGNGRTRELRTLRRPAAGQRSVGAVPEVLAPLGARHRDDTFAR